MKNINHIIPKFEYLTAGKRLNDELPVGLLAQLVGALHRYCRGQGFESRTSLNFFSGFLFLIFI